jgi:hypothetical protein
MIFVKDNYLLLTILLPFFFTSQIQAQDVVQPKVYHANNEVYTLAVSPLSPDGLNGAQYALQKEGETIWHKQLKSTAVMADVSADREIITCSYTRGLEPTFDRNHRKDLGYMQLSLMNEAGDLIWSQSIKRYPGMRIHGPPVPYCEQVLLQSQTKQALFWYHQDQRTRLKAIDVKTANDVQGIDLSLEQARNLTSIKDIKFHDIGGSDLLLVEITGRVYEDNDTGDGSYSYLSDALYYLLDTNGRVYWHQQLMGSLDIRKTRNKDMHQHAYRQRDAYLMANDLIQLNHEKQQFAITDYNAQQVNWFQLTSNHQVKSIKSEPLVNISTPFTQKVNKQTTPKLVSSIKLRGKESHQKQPCDQIYTAIDVTADGALLLYNEDNHTVTQMKDSAMTTLITVPIAWIKDEYISHLLMFVGQHDQIYVNLGESNYAVYAANGQYLETQVWEQGCGEFCFTDFVMQKPTGKLWSENRDHRVMLVHHTEEKNRPEVTIEKDAHGRWLEYMYEMQSDHQGRLMLLGRTEDAFNHLYVWDAKGAPVTTFDLGYGYSSAATISDELAFISEANNDEIAVLNFSGEVIQRFKTSNNQHPYLLRAHQGKLYAVTQDAVLVYNATTFNKK